MSVQTDSNGQIVKKQTNVVAAQERKTIEEMLNDPRVKSGIAQAIPRHMSPDRLLRLAFSAVRTSTKLRQCTSESFLACVFQSAQLGLEPNTPMQHCYLIPRNMSYKDNAGKWHKRMECTFLMGYQGMVELATRSGKVAGVTADVVREGDTFEYERGLTERLVHKPSLDGDRDKKPITHVYAIGKIRGADPVWKVLSTAQVIARKNRSSARDDGPWKTDEEAMFLKTAVRALFTWIPKSTEMAVAEALEIANDTGRNQSRAFDSAVVDALEKTGMQAIEEAATDDDEPPPEDAEEQPEPGAEG